MTHSKEQAQDTMTVPGGSAELNVQLQTLVDMFSKGAFREVGNRAEELLQQFPDVARLHNIRGAALASCGLHQKAVLSYRRALEIQPEYPQALKNLGNALRDINDVAGAMASYEKALVLKPDYAEVFNDKGAMLQSMGNAVAAAESYRRAMQLRPSYTEAYWNYASVTRFTNEDPYLFGFRAVAARPELPDVDRKHLSFALGKAELDIGNNETAFKHIETGNALRKHELSYDIEKDRALFKLIRKAFGKQGPSIDTSTVPATTRPVFIVGMPRTGSSVIEQILASHSQVYSAGEIGYLDLAIRWSNWQKKSRDTKKILELRSAYLDGLGRLSRKPVTTDKNPLNFRWIGMIVQAFPEATILHIRRDPMAVCWSNYRHYFPSEAMGFTFDQRDLAEYYNLYEDLMGFWHEMYPGRIVDIDYDLFTEHQEAESRKLFSEVGLDWEDQVLHFHESDRLVRTASSLQIRQKMYRGSSDEWKKYEHWLRPMQKQLQRNRILDTSPLTPQEPKKEGKTEAAHKGNANLAKEEMNSLTRLSRERRFIELGDRAEALLQKYPNSSILYNAIGMAQAGLGRSDLAIETYRKALDLDPDAAEIYNNLGNSQMSENNVEGALESYERALFLAPYSADANGNLGMARQAQGDTTGALECFKKAVQLNPRAAIFYRGYAWAAKVSPDDPLLEPMQELAARSDLSVRERIQISFALGKSWLDIGDKTLGMEYLATGNSLGKYSSKYSIKRDQNLFAKIREAFDSSGPSIEVDRPIAQTRPVFVMGLPRSGTTLVEQILSAHSEAQGVGETRALSRILDGKDWQSRKLNSQDLSEIRRQYFERICRISRHPVTVDKSLLDFRWIGVITSAFPEASIVFVKRDPRAICWSNYKQYFEGGGLAFTFDLRDLARYCQLTDDLMEFWNEKFPGRIHTVEYEELTNNQEAESRKLLAAAGLEWEEQVMSFHKSDRPVYTVSQSQVRKEIYKGSSRDWEKYKPWLAPMLEIFDDDD